MSASGESPGQGPFDDKPDVGPDTSPVPEHDVFISYSSVDRARVNGLRELLVGLNKDVFQDHVSIPAGRRWRAELDEGITKASSLVLFWTKNSAASKPVKMEYEWFATQRRQRPLIPILGDDTPLPPILAERQAANLLGPGTENAVATAYGVVNDVLEMKRDLQAKGRPAGEVMDRVEARLKQAGVELDTEQKQRLVFLFMGFGLKEILRRYWGEAFKQVARVLAQRARDYSRDITILISATAIAVAAAHLFPLDGEDNPQPDPIAPVDSVPVARPDSAADIWIGIVNYFDTIPDETDIDLGPLRNAVQAGVNLLSEQHDTTQALLDDIRARLPFDPTTDAGGRLSSVILARLYENWLGIESTGRDVARVLALLDTAGVDLGPLRRELSVGFLQTHTLIDDVRAMLVDLNVDGTTVYEGLSEAEIQLFRTELRGARTTLNLIYDEVVDGSVDDPVRPEISDLSREVRRIDSLSAVQQDTIREILARLRASGPAERPTTGIIRTVRIYLPPGPGSFAEPTPDCSGEVPCAIADLPYGGEASELVDGEVTVMARISTAGVVSGVETLSVSPPGNERLPTLARRIVNGWKFNPGMLGETLTEVQMFVVFVFVP